MKSQVADAAGTKDLVYSKVGVGSMLFELYL